MRYKLICSNKDGSFTIREDEIEKMQKGREQNIPTVFIEGIVLNWNMYVGVVADYERMREIAEADYDVYRAGEIRRNKLKEPTPFAKFLSEQKELLAGKFSKLPEKIRSKVDVEVAEEERKSR